LSHNGGVDPSNSRLITLDLENIEPHLPHSIAFHILVIVNNLIIHWPIMYGNPPHALCPSQFGRNQSIDLVPSM
jgi:hypothetical protein